MMTQEPTHPIGVTLLSQAVQSRSYFLREDCGLLYPSFPLLVYLYLESVCVIRKTISLKQKLKKTSIQALFFLVPKRRGL